MKRNPTARKTLPALAKSASAAPKGERRSFAPPYPPSWINRLADRLDRLSRPAWAYYLGAALLLAAFNSASSGRPGPTRWARSRDST